ncbi:hypothetical protein WR25_10058 [Diploscapter pachys]|uniref:Uncharacterized protein n=1 Tax=Diploscapter pachys TaxID=2018661 RepID=A0A2A2JA97_9BILA|nr:hypothetical protein WR25_10058 [Diploscapter pachys]
MTDSGDVFCRGAIFQRECRFSDHFTCILQMEFRFFEFRSSFPLTAPIMCTPNILSVCLSASTFTNPSWSLFVFAREFAANGNLPILYSTP